MTEKMYSQRLGSISDAQFQAALDRFHAGRFTQAEAISFGIFGQNVFVSSTTGEYVLRGDPHFWWQFPTEQFFARQLHERTSVPVPWPYLIDPTPDIFGWSFVLMPRMPGLQLADPQVKKQLGSADRRGIAQALGETLAQMQQVTMPFAGRYNASLETIEPFELAYELVWPLPVTSDASLKPKIITYSERVTACLRHLLNRAHEYNAQTTTADDILWVEELIIEAQDALNETFEPCLLMEDYKEGNLVVTQQNKRWRVSGVFDLMEAHFGDGEADLSRPIAVYLNEDPQLAGEFFAAYLKHKSLRPGFTRRFPVYMLLDRVILWEFFQRHSWRLCPEEWTFRDWAGQYIAPPVIFDQL
ncbi:MAG TPA: aminoglycoside phosphotransferase family protein [Ktedonobacteraceae bacterium]|jgi:aminoglycoside phosphotransferase (APT) family kinase protein